MRVRSASSFAGALAAEVAEALPSALTLASALLALMFAACPAHATTRRVPAQFPTIQYALISSGPGDTVLVAPGRYYEMPVWPNTQGIKLLSEAGAGETTIDGLNLESVLRILAPVDSTTVIRGFTITNGQGEFGGGIRCIGASPTIRDNRIVKNTAMWYGGGVHCEGNNCTPHITGNLIQGNTVEDGSGGGISGYLASHPVILDNEIRDNRASMLYYGGGIHLEYSDGGPGPIRIERNAITGNSAGGGGGIFFMNPFLIPPEIRDNEIRGNLATFGGGIHANWTLADLSGNDIRENQATQYGGGIFAEECHQLDFTDCDMIGNSAVVGGGGIAFVQWCTNPHLENCTIESNTAAKGAGLYCYYYTSPTIRGCRISLNQASQEGGALLCEILSSPIIQDSFVFDNTAPVAGGLLFRQAAPNIAGCAVMRNSDAGLCFDDAWAGHVPQVRQNSIEGNTVWGLRNLDPSMAIVADQNWWGDATGPYHPVHNPTGLGDPVSDGVVFIPWSTTPAATCGVPGAPVLAGNSLVCRPNPFGASAALDYAIPAGRWAALPASARASAQVTLFDAGGRVVRAFPIQGPVGSLELREEDLRQDGDRRSGGWQAARLPAGVLVARIEAGSYRATVKIVHVR